MPSIESILSKYDTTTSTEEPQSAVAAPETGGGDKISSILSKYGAGPAPTETPQIYTPNPFVATAKSTAAGMANAFAGQPIEDIGEAIGSEALQKAGKGVREYAENIQRENPSQIGSLSDILEKPGAAVQTALGNIAPQLPVSLAGAAGGARLGASLPLPPQGKAIAAGLGGIFGAFAPNYLQEAAEMRGKQHESGQEDKTKAYLTAVPAAGLETVSDVVLGGKFLPDAVTKSAVGKALTGDTLSATGSRAAHVGKQALKGTAAEASTEYMQTLLEQMGGGQDTSTPEAAREREVSAALGGLGGGLISGGTSAFDSRETEQPPKVETEQPATEATQPATEAAQPAPSELDLRTDAEKAAKPIDLTTPTEDFGEVEQPTGKPPINVPPGGFDVKETEDWLDRFERAWAGTPNGAPRKPTVSLATEAYKLGINVAQDDDPKAVIAAMRAEIEARKPPEQKIAEAATTAAETSNAEILSAYPDGNPGIVGKVALEANNAGISSVAQEAAAAKEQELVAQQQEQVVVDTTTGEVLPAEAPVPASDIDADALNKLDSGTLQNWLARSDNMPEFQAVVRTILANRAAAVQSQPEVSDALAQPETGPLYGGGSEQPTVRGEGERAAVSGEGVPPEGQAIGDIPTAEEVITQPEPIGEANGESTNQAAQATPQEVIYAGRRITQPEIDEARAKIAPGAKIEKPTTDTDFMVRGQQVQTLLDKGDIKGAYFAALSLKLPVAFTENAETGEVAMRPGVMFTEAFRREEPGGIRGHKQREQKFRQQHGIKERMSEAKKKFMADHAEANERRLHSALRKHIDEMSHDEKNEAIAELRRHTEVMKTRLYTSPVAKIPNRLAYEDSPKKPYVASLDVDSLKWINDNMGHQFGDALIERVGAALQHLDAYHVSGDEFVVQGESESELAEKLKAAQDSLKNAEIEAELPDGTVIKTRGVGFSYGIAADIANAETRLHKQKQQREEQGLRAERGGTPPGVVIQTAEGDNVSGTSESDVAPVEKARKLLLSVAPSGELNALTGKQNVENRARLIEALTGVKPAKTKATNELLRQVFYDAAGIDPGQTIRDKELQFAAWATQTEVEKEPEVVEKLAEVGITQKYPVDFAAQKEAAASRFNGRRELPENRDAQKKAYTEIQGMPIGIENPQGSIRKGKGWETEMKAHYGFFTGVKGADGDYLDVFIKPKLTQAALDSIESVFVVDQIEPSVKGRGNFDEAKVMIGYKSLADARRGYLANYSKGWRGLGAITEMPIEQFKARIESGEAWDKPVTYVQDATKTPNAIIPPTGLEELQVAIGKLGGIKRVDATRAGFSDFKGRKYQYIFNNSRAAKSLDEMAENLRGYGYQVDGENDLIEKLTNSLNGAPFYSPEGAELYAERIGEEYKSDDQLQAEFEFLADVDAADIPEADKEAFKADILDGDFDPERDRKILDNLIAKYAPAFSRRLAAPGQTDLFATTKEEMAELNAKQGVADYAAQKDKRRQGNGAEPPPLFSDYPGFMGQVDIEDKASAEKIPDTLVIDGVRRPTTNSEGKYIHETEDGIRNFWRWFGNSKVVDEQGRPKVVYHGTNAEAKTGADYERPQREGIDPFAPISDFDILENELEFGAHFGTKTQAAKFSGTTGEVYPVYLKAEGLLEGMADLGSFSTGDVIKHAYSKGYVSLANRDNVLRNLNEGDYVTAAIVARRYLREAGIEGLRYLNRGDGVSKAEEARLAASGVDVGDFLNSATDAEVKAALPSADYSYAVFNPYNIKSAIGNVGTFSEEAAEIQFSRPAAKEQSLPDLFQSLGKFDKAPESINHPDAERIRYVQDNFLDLLSELESNKKVEIKC